MLLSKQSPVKHNIMGNNKAKIEQMINYVKDVNPNFNEDIAKSFLDISEVYGVRGDIAFCQSIHETNWFRYGGDVSRDQHNFAGIGATGGVPGHSFKTVEEGVTAQIQHLYAYATTKDIPKGETLVDPRFNLVKRGSAPYWEDLGGKWAYPGYNREHYRSFEQAYKARETYGHKIIFLYEKLMRSEVEKVPRDFTQYTINEFQQFLKNADVKRNVSHIQIHHTWKPRKSDYTGESTILGMWRYHTDTRGWQDIGQHFSVAPDGTIWDGRSLDLDPAGIAGHNNGGVMFEMIGNFNEGEEELEGEQLAAVVAAVRNCLSKFNLHHDDIVFHREHASKTCPGTGIKKDWFLQQIKKEGVKGVSTNYPSNLSEWKKDSVDWLFKEGLLKGEEWKGKVNEPMPLWATAILIKRLFETLDVSTQEKSSRNSLQGYRETEKWKKEAVEWLYDHDLLTSEEWKQKIEEPFPLWAQAFVTKRLYEKVNGKK